MTTQQIYPQIENFIKSTIERIENRLFEIDDFKNVSLIYYVGNPNIELIHYKNVLVGKIHYTITENGLNVTLYDIPTTEK